MILALQAILLLAAILFAVYTIGKHFHRRVEPAKPIIPTVNWRYYNTLQTVTTDNTFTITTTHPTVLNNITYTAVGSNVTFTLYPQEESNAS